MSEKGYGGRLFDKVAKERGISKSRIYKILALQRLCDEVKRLGDEGKIRESSLLEISKITIPAHQKLLADLVLTKGLTVDVTRELSRLIRAAEKAQPDKANDLWEDFFELKENIENKGMTTAMAARLRQAAGRAEAEVGSGLQPAVSPPAQGSEPKPAVQPGPSQASAAEPALEPETTVPGSARLTNSERRLEAVEAETEAEPAPRAVPAPRRGPEADEADADPLEVDIDPELRQALGFPEIVECVSGRGLDVGTTNIVSAGRTLDGKDHYVIQRNAFLDVRNDSFTKRMLIKLGIDHVMHESRMYVIGDPAFELANIFEKETRRPMKDGLISPLETDALQMASMIIHQVIGPPREPGELIYFSVPADPIDADRNVIYHRGALDTILRRQGYAPKPMIEGHSVVLAELEADDFTGIGISCGGGMFNVCIAYKSVPAITFSTARAGDWVDINVGKALGIPASQATAIKEGGVDLTSPKNRQEEAICIYYRELIHYTLTTIRKQMESVHNLPSFSRPVELVCAGGTSLIKGFIKVFEEEYEKVLFPIEVKRIRLARDPLRSVALGCMAAALEEMAVRTGARPDASPTLQSAHVAAPPAETIKSLPVRSPSRKAEKRDAQPASDAVTILPSLPPGPRRPEGESKAGVFRAAEEVAKPLPKIPAKAIEASRPAETVLPGPAPMPAPAAPDVARPAEEVAQPLPELPAAPPVDFVAPKPSDAVMAPLPSVDAESAAPAEEAVATPADDDDEEAVILPVADEGDEAIPAVSLAAPPETPEAEAVPEEPASPSRDGGNYDFSSLIQDSAPAATEPAAPDPYAETEPRLPVMDDAAGTGTGGEPTDWMAVEEAPAPVTDDAPAPEAPPAAAPVETEDEEPPPLPPTADEDEPPPMPDQAPELPPQPRRDLPDAPKRPA
jgi:actin-like ATPase involved in cell morphogenesis